MKIRLLNNSCENERMKLCETGQGFAVDGRIWKPEAGRYEFNKRIYSCIRIQSAAARRAQLALHELHFGAHLSEPSRWLLHGLHLFSLLISYFLINI